MLHRSARHRSELRLERVTFASQEVVIIVTARRHVVACPACGHASRCVHSYYRWTLADLLWHGLQVRLELSVRRFFCDDPDCARCIFTEQLPATAAPYAQRTTRADGALDAIGLALGGAGGACLAAALGLITSPTSVLQHLRHVPLLTDGAPRVVGIDDWAWRKGMVYGTIVVDLEAWWVLELLPDREIETVTGLIARASADRSDHPRLL